MKTTFTIELEIKKPLTSEEKVDIAYYIEEQLKGVHNETGIVAEGPLLEKLGMNIHVLSS